MFLPVARLLWPTAIPGRLLTRQLVVPTGRKIAFPPTHWQFPSFLPELFEAVLLDFPRFEIMPRAVPLFRRVAIQFANAQNLVHEVLVPLVLFLRTTNRIFPTIGRLYGCTVIPVSVQDDQIQVMSTCPPGRTSAWLVQIFKSKTLKHVQQELDHSENFWLEGYYARPSDAPLTESELSIYLGSAAKKKALT